MDKQSSANTAVSQTDGSQEADLLSAESLSPRQKILSSLSKAWKWIVKAAGFVPITAIGIAYAVLLALTFKYIAVEHSDIVWIAAASALIIIEAVMILAVVIGSISVWTAWKKLLEEGLPDINAQTGLEYETGMKLKTWPVPFVEVETKWLDPGDKISAECRQDLFNASEFITALRRCSSEEIERRFIVRDILGLSSIRWTVKAKCRVRVYPAKSKLNNSTITTSMSGGEDISDPYGSPEGDRIEMRQYAPGDSSRAILWKVYARSRRLVVRMPERALTARPRTCAYMIAGRDDEGSAGLARAILESNLLGENWIFGADGCAGYASTLSESMEMLASSGNHCKDGCGLGKFLQEAAAKGYYSCFVFVPSSSGEWMDTAVRAAGNTSLTVTWLMGFEKSLEKFEQEKPWERFVYLSEHVSVKEPSKVSKALSSERTPVILCENATGRVIGSAAAYFAASEKAV